jgi:hypothetical protein
MTALDQQSEARTDLGEAVAAIELQAAGPRGLARGTDLKLAPDPIRRCATPDER